MKRGQDVESAPKYLETEDSHGALFRNRRVIGTLERARCGRTVKEAKVANEPEAVVAFFEALGFAVKRIGLEAGPLSQWLHGN
jgi:hypothetical protein